MLNWNWSHASHSCPTFHNNEKATDCVKDVLIYDTICIQNRRNRFGRYSTDSTIHSYFVYIYISVACLCSHYTESKNGGDFHQWMYLRGFCWGGPLFSTVWSQISYGHHGRKTWPSRVKYKTYNITNVWLMWLFSRENYPLLHFQPLLLTQYDVSEMVVMAT